MLISRCTVSQNRFFRKYGPGTSNQRKVRKREHLCIRSAVFDNLTRSLNKAWDNIRIDGMLTEDNLKGPMREMRRALLEADVSLPVVRRFVSRVQQRALGVKVLRNIKPQEQLVKVVYDELVALMGGQQVGLVEPENMDQPQVIVMAGLQGTGKTTTCGKLAKFLLKQNKKVILIACDVYRPAAIDQLVKVGAMVGVEVFQMGTKELPQVIAQKGFEKARQQKIDAVIVDTAGRLQIDEFLMNELKSLKEGLPVTDTLLVVDAMTGQEAASLVSTFNEAVGLTGAILTKIDGDSRGGAALTVKEVSGCPIKFTGSGEKMDALEQFYPDRMARRVLGMGDILSLVEKAEEIIKKEQAEEMMQKIQRNKFDLNDFLKQYKMMAQMGGMQNVIKMMPGMSDVSEKELSVADRRFRKYSAMIDVMTEEERSFPETLARDPAKRRRVARESGYQEKEVSELLTLFTQMRMQMQTMSKMMAIGGKDAQQKAGVDDEQLMNELLQGSMKPVSAGKVRRKKDKDRFKLEMQKTSAKGFA
eukprot:TRINITY_DN9644_c1_g1_i2.p1 TRINITY_DN9644_c1_g1~~TRINITY_DN9644_c1_g1_i2.p1  ORF type:complete len:550 (-),score=77.11 TRINITY_DN9644_c1_g1_i2:544-2136(-)